MRISWDEYFMKIAQITALRSPDKTKVGAVIVDKNTRIISTGYNGLPKSISENIDWSDRITVRKIVIHAETNALLYLKGGEPDILYCTLSPCTECVKLIKTAGINTVYYATEFRDFQETSKLCEYFGITLIKFMC